MRAGCRSGECNVSCLGLADSSLEMDWIRQARLNTPSLAPIDSEKEFGEFGGEEDGDTDDHVQEERLGEDGEIPSEPFSSSKLANICLLDKTGFGLLSTE